MSSLIEAFYGQYDRFGFKTIVQLEQEFLRAAIVQDLAGCYRRFSQFRGFAISVKRSPFLYRTVLALDT